MQINIELMFAIIELPAKSNAGGASTCIGRGDALC